MEFATLRQAICAVTKIPVEDLPSVGELVQVKDEYQDWTGVIERMMRGFGISLVVPESRYDAVSRYVNGRRLVDPQWHPNRGLRLEFFRVQRRRRKHHASPVMNDWFLVGWNSILNSRCPAVAKVAIQRFRHVCCDSIEQFQRREFLAVTREGSIHDGERHVKDDRRRISDPSDYVLGWSNEKKLHIVCGEFTRLPATN